MTPLRTRRPVLLSALALVLVLGPLAALVQTRWTPLLRLDVSTTAAAERLALDQPAVPALARLLTHLGDPALMTLLSALGCVLLLARGHRREAAFLALVRLGSLVLSQGTKAAIGRTRPLFTEPVAEAAGFSFPSGHALGAAAVWTAIALVLVRLLDGRRRLLVGLALGVPVVVAATRVLLGVHFLSDVVGGLVLGAAWTGLCAAALLPRAPRPDRAG